MYQSKVGTLFERMTNDNIEPQGKSIPPDCHEQLHQMAAGGSHYFQLGGIKDD
jgi:hypothetical protein